MSAVAGPKGGKGFAVRLTRAINDPWDLAAAVLMLAAFLVAMATFRDYGYSWDEASYQALYGKLVLNFLSTFGSDKSAVNTYNLYLYGGAYDSLRELVVSAVSLDPRNVRHFCNAAVGLLCLVGAWLTGRLAYGTRAGFFTALLLAVCPPFWGHIFINPKDIPFAAGYIWSLYWLLRFDRELPKPKPKVKALLAVALGLTLGVRIGGSLLVMYMVFLCVRSLLTDKPREPLALAASFVTVLVPAYMLMLVFWPAALLSPISIPVKAFTAATNFKWVDSVLFNGQTYLSNELPATYLPVVFGVGLPEVVLAVVIIGVFWAAWRAVKSLFDGAGKIDTASCLLLVAALFPPIWAIAMKATLYDNMRHFLFILPVFCCMAGGVVSFGIGKVLGVSGKAAYACMIVFAILLAYPVWLMVRLHPFQYVYINSLGGGMPEGEKRFETDYWLTSYREALSIAAAHAAKVAAAEKISLHQAKFTLVSLGTSDVIREDLPGYFKLVRAELSIPTDYVIVTTRWEEDWTLPEYPLIGTVGRMGMRFAKVYASPAMVDIVEGRARQY